MVATLCAISRRHRSIQLLDGCGVAHRLSFIIHHVITTTTIPPTIHYNIGYPSLFEHDEIVIYQATANQTM